MNPTPAPNMAMECVLITPSEGAELAADKVEKKVTQKECLPG
jgi:hypothetical protein